MSDTATTVDDSPTSDSPVLTVTPAARDAVMDIRSQEPDAESLALRVEIVGASGVDYNYDLGLEPIAEAAPDDVLHESDGLTVMIPAGTVDRLRGATLDIPTVDGQGGLIIRNPNRPNPLGDMDDLELSGDLEDQVRQLLELRINPALASHGGFATLVKVEDNTAYVTMGGGCQGCSMSAATLTEGIRAAILEAIDEITEVVDATDHDAGANPYFD